MQAACCTGNSVQQAAFFVSYNSKGDRAKKLQLPAGYWMHK
jgi:hypothetical protein